MGLLRGFFRSWMPVIVAFFLGASMMGVAWAAQVFTQTVKAPNFLYTSQKTVKLVIGGAAFVANDDTCNWLMEGGHHLHDFSGCTYSAQVELPAGARITRVQFYIANGSGTTMRLEAWDPGLIPDGTTLASATSDCVGTCVKTDATIPNAAGANPVNNTASHYSIDIDADAGGTILINKVVVTYKTNKVGPASA